MQENNLLLKLLLVLVFLYAWKMLKESKRLRLAERNRELIWVTACHNHVPVTPSYLLQSEVNGMNGVKRRG